MDRETLDTYASRAVAYEAQTRDHVLNDPLLGDFISALPKNARVLDLGCGPGTCAAAIAQAGHCVTAIDPVAEMVAMAQTHPGVTARVGSFDDVTGTDEYQGIWANFSLLHAPRKDMPRLLAALHRALTPGGILHIALKSGTGEKRDAIGRLYTYYSETELRALLISAGFTVTNRAGGRLLGLDGTHADWIALRAYG